ncbi:MAG: hypothetical protein NZ529_00240 [Cytophagaceae bacterium]|nr:hypothetical protein [Cytophagaceae bacterium]MDW8455193.1 hypothetical protein [Cytophagaceae bacterium]
MRKVIFVFIAAVLAAGLLQSCKSQRSSTPNYSKFRESNNNKK